MINFNIRQIQLINKPQKAYNLLKITGLLEFILITRSKLDFD